MMFFESASLGGPGRPQEGEHPLISAVTGPSFVCMSGCLLRFFHPYCSALDIGPRVGFISHDLSASWPSVSPQALVLPVCGAFSRRPEPRPPALSISMRLTLWARSALPPCLAFPTRRRSRLSTSFWWKWMVSTLPGCFCVGRRVFNSF